MLFKIKKFLTFSFLLPLIIFGTATPALAAVAAGPGCTTEACIEAANSDPCHPENHIPPGTKLSKSALKACEDCQGKSVQNCLATNPIVNDINTIVNFLAGLVGLVTVSIIVLGGIQYSMARNKPEAVSAARTRVMNGVIALVAFMLIWAFLQWLIPGGVFNA